MSYANLQNEDSPGWLQTPYGEAWNKSFGEVKDSVVANIKSALFSRFPDYAPPDAVSRLGNERSVIRAPTETDANYAKRVKTAWETWPWAGTAYGMLLTLKNAGFPATAIVTRYLRHSLAADGSPVSIAWPGGTVWTVGTGTWPEFEVIYRAPWPFSAAEAANPNSATAQTVKQIIKWWKPAHTLAVRVVIYSGELWGDPVGTWADPLGYWGDTGTWGDAETWGTTAGLWSSGSDVVYYWPIGA